MSTALLLQELLVKKCAPYYPSMIRPLFSTGPELKTHNVSGGPNELSLNDVVVLSTVALRFKLRGRRRENINGSFDVRPLNDITVLLQYSSIMSTANGVDQKLGFNAH